MANVEARPAVVEDDKVPGPRKSAIIIGVGAVLGFTLAYMVGLVLSGDHLLTLAGVGLCVGGLCGVVVSRLAGQACKGNPAVEPVHR
jgi:hypothetical protein